MTEVSPSLEKVPSFFVDELTHSLDLGLDMILPMQDEETGAEPRVLSASICDPYLLLIRDDSSAFVAHMNSDSELEEVEKEESPLMSTKWASGCLYTDTTALFGKGQGGDKSPGNIFMFLLSAAGALHVSLPRGPRPFPIQLTRVDIRSPRSF